MWPPQPILLRKRPLVVRGRRSQTFDYVANYLVGIRGANCLDAGIVVVYGRHLIN